MGDMDAGGRELAGEIKAIHSRVAKLEQVSQNLTVRKNVDDELDRAWREWETTFDAIKDSIILTDNEFRIVQANLSASQLFGRSLDQIIGKTCWQLVHGIDRPPKECPLKKAKDSKGHQEIELFLPQKGTWIADSVDPVLDQQSGLTGVVHIIRDITDRKQAEQLLRKERDRAQKYLGVAGVMFVAIDAEQRVGLINKKGCEILGYNEDEIIAKNWFDNFLPQSVREQVRAVFQKVVRGELDLLEYYENPILTKNGDQRLIAWHNTVLRDDKGQVIAVLSSGGDITDHKKAEEQLQQERNLLRTLIDHIPDRVYVKDRGSRFVACNKSVITSEGVKIEEDLIGKTDFDLYEKALAQQLFDSEQELMLTGRPIINREYRGPDKTGSVHCVLVTKVPLRDRRGNVVGMVGINRDITERKKAEESRRLSEEKFAKAFNSSPAAIFITTLKEGRFIDLNEIAIRVFGYTREEAVGHTAKELNMWANYNDRDIVVQSVRRGIAVRDMEARFRRKSGEVFDSIISVDIINIAGTECLISTIVDITERKKAEEALQHSEEYFRALTENSSDIIIIVDKKGTVLYISSSIGRFSGYKPEELIGKSAFDFIHPDDLPRAINDFGKAIQTKDVAIPNSFRVRHKDGSERVLGGVGKNLLDNPVIKGFVMNVRDITDRKKAEQKLLEDQAKLKSLASQLTLAEERERRRLAMELHDRVSQTLVISKIKLEALRKSGHSRKLDKALEDVCNSIGQTVQDTRTLTFNLGSPVLYELGFEAAVSEWLTSQIQDKHGIAVEFEDDGQSKPLDDDVRVLLFRDVRELLINVVKHAGAHKVKVSLRRLDNHICVTVDDDGVGFDPDEVISMAAKKGEFGLFSIRERLEDLGGHIQIDSVPGRGCKVTMTAPLKQKEMTR